MGERYAFPSPRGPRPWPRRRAAGPQYGRSTGLLRPHRGKRGWRPPEAPVRKRRLPSAMAVSRSSMPRRRSSVTPMGRLTTRRLRITDSRVSPVAEAFQTVRAHLAGIRGMALKGAVPDHFDGGQQVGQASHHRGFGGASFSLDQNAADGRIDDVEQERPLHFFLPDDGGERYMGVSSRDGIRNFPDKITELLLLNPLAGYCQLVILKETAGRRPRSGELVSFHETPRG